MFSKGHHLLLASFLQGINATVRSVTRWNSQLTQNIEVHAKVITCIMKKMRMWYLIILMFIGRVHLSNFDSKWVSCEPVWQDILLLECSWHEVWRRTWTESVHWVFYRIQSCWIQKRNKCFWQGYLYYVFLFVALSSYIDVASRKGHLNGRFQTAHGVTI